MHLRRVRGAGAQQPVVAKRLPSPPCTVPSIYKTTQASLEMSLSHSVLLLLGLGFPHAIQHPLHLSLLNQLPPLLCLPRLPQALPLLGLKGHPLLLRQDPGQLLKPGILLLRQWKGGEGVMVQCVVACGVCERQGLAASAGGRASQQKAPGAEAAPQQPNAPPALP